MNRNKLSAFMQGMASIFFPHILDDVEPLIEPYEDGLKKDAENIAQYWKDVGSYISKAIDGNKR